MEEYSEYFSQIFEIKTFFDSSLRKILQLDDIDLKLEKIMSLISIAVKHNTGYWASSSIEKFLTDYAQTIEIDNYNVEYKKRSFLHVMTMGYKTGGHTRVVERWIKNAPQNQVHSVLFTEINDHDMSVLSLNVKEKNGEFIKLDKNKSVKERARDLRKIALGYEYIILHTHMDDVIPILAFGTEKFTRPVFLYNHASHLFWIGKSIADVVLDIEKDDEVTSYRRNIKDAFFLGVPSKKIRFENRNKYENRKKLGLPVDKKIIISAGSDSKYFVLKNNYYANLIEKLIDEDTYCYIIGLKKNNKKWKKYSSKSKGHLVLLGYIDFKNGYLDYIRCADVYIDSYPFCGGTATIDAVSQGIPSFSLKSVYPQFDYLTSTQAYCASEEEFIKKVKKALNDESYAKEITKELQNSLNEYQSVDAWNKRIENLLRIAPKSHKVKDLSNEKDVNVIDDLTVLVNVLTDKYCFDKNSLLSILLKQHSDELIKYGELYKVQGIPNLFQIFSYRNARRKIKLFKIFNIVVYKHKK